MTKNKIISILMPQEFKNYKEKRDWYISIIQDATTILSEFAPTNCLSGAEQKDGFIYVAENKYLKIAVTDLDENFGFKMLLEDNSSFPHFKTESIQQQIIYKLECWGHIVKLPKKAIA